MCREAVIAGFTVLSHLPGVTEEIQRKPYIRMVGAPAEI
jgi:hypothetical protein